MYSLPELKTHESGEFGAWSRQDLSSDDQQKILDPLNILLPGCVDGVRSGLSRHSRKLMKVATYLYTGSGLLLLHPLGLERLANTQSASAVSLAPQTGPTWLTC